MDRNREGGKVSDLALQLEVGAAGLRPGRRYPNLAQHFGGFQDGAERATEEVAGFDRAASRFGAQDQLGVERQQDRAPVAGGVRVGDRSRDRATVADDGIGDLLGGS